MNYIKSPFFPKRQIWLHLKIEHLTRYMKVDKNIEIQVLRLQIAEKFSIQPERLRISYEGKKLRDMDTLDALGISENHTIEVDVGGAKSSAATSSRINGKGFGFNIPGVEIFDEDITNQLLNLDEMIHKMERLQAFVNQTNFQCILNYSNNFYEWIMSDSRLHVMLQCDPFVANLMKNSTGLKKIVDLGCCSEVLEEMRNDSAYRVGADDSLSASSNDRNHSSGSSNNDKDSSTDDDANCKRNSSEDTEEQSVACSKDNLDVDSVPYVNPDQIYTDVIEHYDNLVRFIQSKTIRFCLEILSKSDEFIDFIISYNENDAVLPPPNWIVNLTKSFTDLEYYN